MTTDDLVDYFRDAESVEVDHAVTLYLEPEMRLPYRDTRRIRDSGYKIQDVTNGEYQTQITLVRDDE